MSSNKKIIVKTKKEQFYYYPVEHPCTPNVEKYFSLPPNSKCWVHGTQVDDPIDSSAIIKAKKVADLKKIIAPEQRSKQWYVQRDGMMTASLIPTALNMNEHEMQYMAIVHKIKEIPFTGKKTCFWGKKFEKVATHLYEYRMNVIVEDFGCIPHKCNFIGASPDGIIGEYKLDQIHKTNLVGRMLEIKCVVSRKINQTSNNVHEVIPEHYFPQPQIQMQCCDLDECDFWQCNIKEYNSRQEFIDDTDFNEPFRSKKTGLEKGVIIQLMPIKEIKCKSVNDMDEARYDHAKWIYPKSIEMSPYDCDKWIAETCTNYRENPEFSNYIVDKIVYWKLVESRCITTKRDDNWFEKQLPILERIWNYVLFLRKNEDAKKIFLDYVDYVEKKIEKSHVNEKIMDAIKIIYDVSNKKYKHNIKLLKNEIRESNKPIITDDEHFGFELCE